MIQTELDGIGLTEMMATFFDSQIAGRRPNEVIERHGSAYIERWMLARKATVPTFVGRGYVTRNVDDPTPIPSFMENLYLHRYCRGDAEDLHCHPWPNVTLVVRGWFVEHTPAGQFTRMPGDLVFRAAEERHAIIDVRPDTLTLFATGIKEREWGFWPNGEFIHHREYSAWKQAQLS